VPQGHLGRSITYSMLALALVIAFAYVLQSILVPVFFSIILSVLLYPVSVCLEHIGFSRAMAALTALFLAILILIGLGYLLVAQAINIGQDASDIVSKIETVLGQAEQWVSEKFNLSRSQLITTGKQ